MKTIGNAKAMAKAMREALAEKQINITHAQALEAVARQFGFATWNILSARIEAEERAASPAITFSPPVPIVRIFDEARAMEFYEGFLGFAVDWRHRFDDGAPLYCQVSLGGIRLHLSEHSGDASPGSTSVVYMKGIEAWQASLIAGNYRYNRPGLTKQDWGLECEVIDPFGNRIRFLEQQA